MTRNRGTRQFERLKKGLKRIKEDRAQHGADHSCDCFDTSNRGKIFARFADHPKVCSTPGCCGNPRSLYGETNQEKRGPKESDWI